MKMTNVSNLCSLEELMSYRCGPAVAVFRRKYLVSEETALDLWSDLLKWLWLGRFHQIDPHEGKPESLFICPSIIAIDEMWHAFLLCTEDYAEFCQRFFGEFLHHVPNPDHTEEIVYEDLASNYRYVLRHLGGRTAVRWYFSLPLIFNGTSEVSTF